MTSAQLLRRSLLAHARSFALVSLAVATTAAVIAGALLVGDSVRGSLRDRALERLGRIEWALTSERTFGEDLGERERESRRGAAGRLGAAVPVLRLRGSVVRTASGRRVSGVWIVGVDDRFSALFGEEPSWLPRDREAVVGEGLAAELGAAGGDALLVSFATESDVPREFALGRRDGTVERLRVDLRGVRPEEGSMLFGLRHQQETPRNVFVALKQLQRALGREGRANTLLWPAAAEGSGSGSGSGSEDGDAGGPRVRGFWRLDDLGLRLRTDAERGYVALESEDFLLSAPIGEAALEAGRFAGLESLEVLTYLANAVRSGGGSFPYSMVTALGEWKGPDGSTRPGGALATGPIAPGRVALSDWTRADLPGLEAGGRVELDYFALEEGGPLRERSALFSLASFVPLEGSAADPGWTPHYEGISDARSFGDWNPPFEIDHSRIRARDEAFWKAHRTTPKAFISLEDGRRLWGSRFGELTAVRYRGAGGSLPAGVAERLRGALREKLDPAALGWRVEPVRARALEAAGTGTDFGTLFVSLSFFIIVAALILVAMTLRLSLQRRAPELGLLRAVGFSRARLARLLLAESLVVAGVGIALGIAAGIGYAALLMAGLRTWWRGAVHAPFLELHVEAVSLAVAAVSTLVLVALTVLAVARRAARRAPHALLQGGGSEERAASGERAGRGSRRAGGLLVLVAVVLVVGSGAGWISVLAAFLGVGACLFAAGLALLSWYLRRRRPSRPPGRGLRGLLALAAGNARRASGRSLLASGLIASATFVVVTVAASRHEPALEAPRRDSGNGGLALVATTDSPLFRSPSRPEGREALGLSARARELLAAEATHTFALRVRPGDDTSCRNLYRPQDPRLLGVPADFIERGGFSWAATLAETDEERANPWRLLEREWPDGVVPAIGDANTVQWILHGALGEDVVVRTDGGGELRLRLVGLLSRSIFQGALLLGERDFTRRFPQRTGWSELLIETPAETAGELVTALEADLGEWGLDARTTGEVLAAYVEVENTYLSTFQILGGMGLLLGTLGLGATLARSVIERRGELALLRALGFSRAALGWLVVAESVWLLFFGIALGLVAALVAMGPHLVASGAAIEWKPLGSVLLLTLGAGIGSCLLAAASAARTPLLRALRAP